MTHKTSFLLFLPFIVLFIGCGENSQNTKQIVVKNTLGSNRSFETVTLDREMLGELLSGNIGVKNAETQKELVSQTIDSDGDGVIDALLFQPELAANSEKVFELVQKQNTIAEDGDPRCYSRFVPERTDDYAWENNRVAFRTYGPTAEKMVEDEVKGGTLSSGIDAWLKRVDYPIINKWYKEELSGEVSYHTDTGEGLDNFHVGPSRGVGGVAMKVDSTYYTSKNFTTWKTLYNGPIRTSFVLTYADWEASGNTIYEEKHISLDYGCNLYRVELNLKGTDMISAGLTLHDKEGIVSIDQEEGWVSYWEPHEDSELGTGIVVPHANMVGHEHYETDEKDKSNLFAHVKVNAESKAVYYAGFAWKKSGQFTTKEVWDRYLSQFSKKLDNPLVVEVR